MAGGKKGPLPSELENVAYAQDVNALQEQVDKCYSAERYEVFQEAVEKGEKKGVNWSEAKLTNFTMDTTAQLDGEMAALQTTGIKAMKGVIDFQSGGTDYQMRYDKIMYLPSEGGWFGGEFSEVARKGEENTPATESKTKSKTKTAAGTTKTKTKTSAGKTTSKTKTKS